MISQSEIGHPAIGTRLAMVVRDDQLSRNMYRDTLKAFAADVIGLTLTPAGLETGDDQPIEIGRMNLFVCLVCILSLWGFRDDRLNCIAALLTGRAAKSRMPSGIIWHLPYDTGMLLNASRVSCSAWNPGAGIHAAKNGRS